MSKGAMKGIEVPFDLEEAKREFIRTARRAVRLGLQSGTGGNVSMRAGPHYLVKPSGKSLYRLTPADLILLDENGTVVSGEGIPTKEVRFHLGIYQSRSNVGGIVHYHAPHAVAYAVRGIPIPAFTIHARRTFPRMPVVPELQDGSQELADAVVEAFGDPEVKLILLASHGLVAVGETLEDAENLAELAEETAKTALSVRILGEP